MRSVLGQLKCGRWKTSNELITETGGTYAEVMDELYSPTNGRRFLRVRVPTDEARVIYHRATPETLGVASLRCPVDIMDLPCALKRSAAKKVGAMHRTRMIRRGLPEWMLAILALEKRLFSKGLGTPRCRPREGLLYPCSWRVDATPNPPILGKHLIRVDFTGTINAKTGMLGNCVVNYETNAVRCWITLRHDRATLLLRGVALAILKTRTLEFVRDPSRKTIMTSTKDMLLDAAAKDERVAMFMPLRPVEFELLSTSETRRIERR